MAERVGKWLPTNPMLIGEPGAAKFLPPILLPQFEQTIARSIYGHSRSVASAFLAYSLVMLVFASIKPDPQTFMIGLLSAGFGLTLALDYMLALRPKMGVVERVLFFYWLRTSVTGKKGVFFWAAFCCMVGAVQGGLQYYVGDRRSF